MWFQIVLILLPFLGFFYLLFILSMPDDYITYKAPSTTKSSPKKTKTKTGTKTKATVKTSKAKPTQKQKMDKFEEAAFWVNVYDDSDGG